MFLELGRVAGPGEPTETIWPNFLIVQIEKLRLREGIPMTRVPVSS